MQLTNTLNMIGTGSMTDCKRAGFSIPVSMHLFSLVVAVLQGKTCPQGREGGGSFQAPGCSGKQQLGPMQLSHSQKPVGQAILQLFVFFLKQKELRGNNAWWVQPIHLLHWPAQCYPVVKLLSILPQPALDAPQKAENITYLVCCCIFNHSTIRFDTIRNVQSY